jgi:hypothetical protein
MKRVALQLCGTDTPVCALGFVSLLGHSSPKLKTENLQLTTFYSGAPPLVCKGGLLRPDLTNSLLFAPAEAQT